jgi:hypothetical protein
MDVLKQTVWQLRAAKVGQCCGEIAALRPHLEKVVAVGGGNSD